MEATGEKTKEHEPLTQAEIEKLQQLSQKIEYVGIDTIRLSPNKARKIRNAIPKVAASIRVLGFRAPIYVDGNANDEIIAGHTRYCAAKLLGLTKVPIVRVTDLKPSLVKFLRLADNRVSDFTSWNQEELNRTLLDLRSKMPDIDFGAFGFVDPLDIDFEHAGSLDDYDEPNERNLRCPECGYEGTASFFQKEEQQDDGTDDKEESQPEPAQEQQEPKPKHDPEDMETVLKEVAKHVPKLDQAAIDKIQSLAQKIEYVAIDSIRPSPNKERYTHKGVDKVAAVIRKVGFRNPIYVAQDGEIVCGHTRYQAAQSLGLTQVPIVRVSDLTEDELTLLRLADNRVAEFSEWEYFELNSELAELKVEMPEDLEDSGLFEKNLLLWDAESHEASGGGTSGEKTLICPKCGHRAGASMFKKEG